MSKIYFFRHAQASFGAVNYDVLSPKGEQQSAELGKYLVAQKYKFNKVFVGPLRRQQHTYEIVKEIYGKNNLSIPDPIMVQGLDEHKAPEAFKKLMPSLKSSNPYVKDLVEKMTDDPKRMKANNMLIFQYFLEQWVSGKINAEGVISWKDFYKNVKDGLDRILKETDSGQTNAAFTSGGTISCITAEALGMTNDNRIAALNFAIRNTSFTSFFYSKGKFNLHSINELPHLEREMVSYV